MAPRSALLAVLLLWPLAAASQAVFEQAFPDLPPFERPTALRQAGNDDGRFYVVEQGGQIHSFVRDSLVTEAPVFLDISDRVYFEDLSEPGLLGLAFHPAYADNGYFYVTYITEEGAGLWRTRLSRFTAIPDVSPPAADPESELILFEIERTDWHHNGGDLHFGCDGYLYVSLGDGRCCLDPDETGQDRSDLLGSILRLDVDNPTAGLNYGIPPDNPFVGNTQGWREEVWAYGFRNPWRFSIDPETGDVWVGDVGELTWEEVNVVEAGGNYGWDDMEGPECREEPDCDPSEYASPVWSYDRTLGNAVTGGYVYHGALIPELDGQYVFADWGSRRLWAMAYDPDDGTPPEVTLLSDFTGLFISSFGTDPEGELFAVNTFLGTLWQLVPLKPSAEEPPPPAPEEPTLRLRPNPASSVLEVEAPLGEETVAVYDALGRRLAEAPLLPGCSCARLELDLTTFPAGVYVARVGELTEPFTVVR
jgi:glucose/arabinose dehydrogenase